MRTAILPLALALSVLDPMVACTGHRDFDYSAADMKHAVEGTWLLVIQEPGQPAAHYTLALRQAGDARQNHAARTAIRSAAACTTRSFVREAGACLDISQMPLEVHVAGIPDAHGRFEVVGTSFETGRLELSLGKREITARISRLGIASGASDGYESRTLITLVRANGC